MMLSRTIGFAAIGIASSLLLLSGCSTSFAPGPETPTETAFGPVSGLAYGGQQPIVGAHIYAYQTSATAYGGASKSLLGETDSGGYPTSSDGENYYVTTDSAGYFSISAATTCTSGTVVYLYSVNGQPTPGVTNASAGEMAVLGVCPSSGLLVNALTTGTSVQIFMNEVSTVAGAYSLAGFAIDATHIGALTTTGGVVTDTLAQTGIQNAAANAAQMYTTVATSGTGTGATRAALAATPNGNGVVPQAELDTLANILAACINSASPFTACNTLFADATADGTATGTQPTDTASAAINIAHHPAANVSAIFNLMAATGVPFSPDLATAPANFTVGLSFTGGGLAETNGGEPNTLAIDASGNVWATSFSTTTLGQFSPLGVPVSSTGYTGIGLDGPFSVALDINSESVWLANQTGGNVTKFSIGSGTGTNYGSDLTSPTYVAIDGSGDAWAANAEGILDGLLNPYSITKLSGSTGDAIGKYIGGGLNEPYAIAFEPGTAGDVWVANGTATGTESLFTNSGNAVPGSPLNTGTGDGPYSVAVDASGSAWFPAYAYVARLTASGSSSNTALGSNDEGIAIDGAGDVWVTDQGDKTVYELNNSGTNLSATAGYVPLPSGNPDAIAIDGSGDVWYNTSTDATLRELIGAATPVATPLAYGVANSLLGTRP